MLAEEEGSIKSNSQSFSAQTYNLHSCFVSGESDDDQEELLSAAKSAYNFSSKCVMSYDIPLRTILEYRV